MDPFPHPMLLSGPGVMVIAERPPMHPVSERYYTASGDQSAPGRRTDDLPTNGELGLPEGCNV